MVIGVALDIDGTLVDRSGLVFPRVKDALRRYWHTVVFILVSARPPLGVESVLKQIQREGPYVALNGGLIALGIGKEPISVEYLPDSVTTAILEASRAWEDSRVAIFSFGEKIWVAWGEMQAIDEEARLNTVHPKIVDRVDEISVSRSIKLTVVCRDSLTWDRIFCELKTSAVQWRVEKSRPYYIEVTAVDTSKEKSLAVLVRELGISDLIAVGDGENDIGMFRIARLSYAAPSAPSVVKRAACFVLSEPADLALSTLIGSIDSG